MSRLDQNVAPELKSGFSCSNKLHGKEMLYTVMCDMLSRHHDEISFDQLKSLVLTQDSGFHHALNIVDAERPAGQAVSGTGPCNVHCCAIPSSPLI